MNILAATSREEAKDEVYNVAVGDRTSLNNLFQLLKDTLNQNQVHVSSKPIYREFRAGDVRHSQADISKARDMLGYQPFFNISQGINEAMPWYISMLENK